MPKNIIKAVIFDMDGVLVDSQPLHFDADVAVLKRCGINAGLKDVQKYAGMSNNDRWAKYKKDYSIGESVEEIIGYHSEVILEMMNERDIKAGSYVADLLDMLRKNGISLSVASSSSYDFVYKMLEKINLRQYFNIVISGEDFEKSKPDPDIFIHAAEKHGAAHCDCVIIEDSSNGVKAANAAGIRCVGYKNASSGEQDLSLASLVVSSFRELLDDTDWLYK